MSGQGINLSGLVGVPYGAADCWGVVVAGLHRLGVAMPLDHADAVRRSAELVEVLPAAGAVRTGDILQFKAGSDGRTHVGLVVDDGGERFLHALGKEQDGKERVSSLSRVKLWRTHLDRVLRPRALNVQKEKE